MKHFVVLLTVLLLTATRLLAPPLILVWDLPVYEEGDRKVVAWQIFTQPDTNSPTVATSAGFAKTNRFIFIAPPRAAYVSVIAIDEIGLESDPSDLLPIKAPKKTKGIKFVNIITNIVTIVQ